MENENNLIQQNNQSSIHVLPNIQEAEEMLTAIDQVLEHMGLLGYNIEIEEDGTIMAYHPLFVNVIIDEYCGAIHFTAFYKLTAQMENQKRTVLKRINAFNNVARLCRCNLDNQSYLELNAYFPDFYDKSAFGIFIATLNWDATLLYMPHIKLDECFE